MTSLLIRLFVKKSEARIFLWTRSFQTKGNRCRQTLLRRVKEKGDFVSLFYTLQWQCLNLFTILPPILEFCVKILPTEYWLRGSYHNIGKKAAH